MEVQLESAALTGRGATRWTIVAVAMAFAAFQIWASLLNPLPAVTLRSVHAAFLVLLCFLIFTANGRPRMAHARWYDWFLAGAAALCGIYFYQEASEFGYRVGFPTTADLLVGTVFIVLVFEATRRATGYLLPIMCGLVLVWGLLGEHLPNVIAHRGYDYDQIVGQLVIGTGGLFGTATAVSATYIFLFVLFAAFMQQSGILSLFNDISMWLVGRWRSGPAQACILSSALMGTVSGSGIANVVTSGQLTIPLMRRYGYRSHFAAGVEVSSSVGGQIMPPVMGAGAFIMAEMLGVPYSVIAASAAVPAVLYFFGIAWMAYLEARRLGLSATTSTALGVSRAAISGRWHLLLPLAVIMLLLFAGYTPIYAATAALTFTVLQILVISMATLLPGKIRWLFHGSMLLIGLLLLLRFDASVLACLIGVLLAGCATFPHGRSTLRLCFRSVLNGTMGAVAVGITCVIVGVFDGIFGLSGVMLEVASGIVAIGADQLWLSLLLAMAICLVLGLGLPTVPSYVISAVVVAPALAQLGIAPLVSHMFVFYFSVLSALTPPIALAAIAAQPMSGPGVSATRIATAASMLAISGLLIPFVAVYSPELLLIDAHWSESIVAIFRVCIAVFYSGAAIIGYFRTRIDVAARLCLAIASGLLVSIDPLWYGSGTLLGATILFNNYFQPFRISAVSSR
uniref:TRAP transporter permease n=1 Tax=Brucella pseudintermedia TaxID=370111 RepID=UPI001588D16E|nr:TRAP transporter fused permease subunit [Brucella pseudintermedia]